MANSIKLGEDTLTGYKVYLDLVTPETNGSLMILGESGAGKTYGTQVIINELAELGYEIIILDLTGSLSRTQGEMAFFSNIEERLDYINVARDGLPMNLFERLMLDAETPERDSDIAGRLVDSLSACIGKGTLQGNALYEAVKNMFAYSEKCGEVPSLGLLRDILLSKRDTNSRKAAGKLLQLMDGDYFREYPSQLLLGNQRNIKLLQMQSVQPAVKPVLADLILWHIWSRRMQQSSKEKPVFIVIDEFQNVRCAPSSPLYRVLCEGRKFGLSLLLATQFFQGRFSDNMEMAVAQVGNKMFFKPPDREIKSIARHLTQDRAKFRRYEGRKMNEDLYSLAI